MTTIANPEPAGAKVSAVAPSLPRFEKQRRLTISLRCGRLANRLIIFQTWSRSPKSRAITSSLPVSILFGFD
jgi:hypothetical protein